MAVALSIGQVVLSTDGTYNYLYDNEGNTIRRTKISDGSVREMAWDHRNRLVSVTDRVSLNGAIQKSVQYVYDAFDNKVGKLLDADGNGTIDSETAWVYSEGHALLQFRDTDGVGSAQNLRLSNRYLYADIVDMLLADEQFLTNNGPLLSATSASGNAGTSLWPLTDHLGSVRDVVDNNKVVRQHVNYDAFGNRIGEVYRNASGTVVGAGTAGSIQMLFGFTGRDWDTDSELQYNRARWFDPKTGRWMSQDPISFAAGQVNLYGYVNNSPTNAIDPSGLDEFSLTKNKLTRTFGARWNVGNRMENWNYGFGELNHTKHRIAFALRADSDADSMLAQAYSDLATFKYFNDGHNDFARVYIDEVVGQLYAGFDVETLIKGTAADITHLCDKAGVKLDLYPARNLVEARTVGGHPLVGVRRWRAYLEDETVPASTRPIDLHALLSGSAIRVPTGRKILIIETESFDKVSGPLNYVAMKTPLIGLASDQLRIWELYFMNIRDAYSKNAEYLSYCSNIKGTSHALPAETPNPWRFPGPEISFGIRK